MSFIGKLITSLVVAAIASTIMAYLVHGTWFSLAFMAVFAVSNLVTALLVTMSPKGIATTTSTGSTPIAKPKPKPISKPKSTPNSKPELDREQGTVKWFNVSKGFGFITRSNGEEIFVHFRSIRGEGRRSLRDGEPVSFSVTQSDKGPQAEDVEALGSDAE